MKKFIVEYGKSFVPKNHELQAQHFFFDECLGIVYFYDVEGTEGGPSALFTDVLCVYEVKENG